MEASIARQQLDDHFRVAMNMYIIEELLDTVACPEGRANRARTTSESRITMLTRARSNLAVRQDRFPIIAVEGDY
jgi:hypothetical protein